MTQKLATEQQARPPCRSITSSSLPDLPKRGQTVVALKRRLSNYLELAPQGKGTYRRAVPLVCNTDSTGKQKLRGLES